MKNIDYLRKNGVDIDKSLELFGDEKKYNSNLGTFLVGIHSCINKLIEFMKQKDLANYSVYVHSLKTDARYFGFSDLAKMAEKHEAKAKQGDMYYINNNINNLIGETNKAIILVQKYMNDVEVQNVDPKDSDVYNKKTILVVDDSNIVRNFVKRVFEEKYNVGTAKNGKEAIRIIEANKSNDNIEVILLDLNMPKVDGFAVLEYMRENDLFEIMPVSVISGDSTKETIDRAFTYDIVDMLNKPFNEKSVKQVIDKTIIYKEKKDNCQIVCVDTNK